MIRRMLLCQSIISASSGRLPLGFKHPIDASALIGVKEQQGRLLV
jgi:hypothetical protein